MRDRKADWRQRHPDRERQRRDLDNEARRFKAAYNREHNRPATAQIPCSVPGCNLPAQLHHRADGGFDALCREHHQHAHNDRGDGPGSNGPGRGQGVLVDQDGALRHHPRNGRTVGSPRNPLVGLKR